MSYFSVEIQNSGNDQQFIIQATDLVDAMMKGNELVEKIDQLIKERFGREETTHLILVGKWAVLDADEDGINEYLVNNKDYFEAEAIE